MFARRFRIGLNFIAVQNRNLQNFRKRAKLRKAVCASDTNAFLEKYKNMNRQISWRNDLAEARREAENLKKPLFVDWADFPSCVGCVSLENNTYPNPDVIDFVSDNFVPVQLNQSENLELFRQNKVVWTPTITVCDALGTELMKWIGYLPSAEFLPKVKFVLAWTKIIEQDYAKASTILEEIGSMHKNSFAAPEALYWLGVAKWKTSRDFTDLSEAWTNLMETYPESEAAQKALCL